ncbi:MAG TPA: hypothetical protein DHN29_21550 [Cytophagales bacterium]|nr:hypothetical protein [Cytophagales bacterium]
MVDDVLVLDFPGAKGTGTRLTIIDTDQMESKAVNASFQFIRNDEGEVTGFTADQNGVTEWKKIE